MLFFCEHKKNRHICWHIFWLAVSLCFCVCLIVCLIDEYIIIIKYFKRNSFSGCFCWTLVVEYFYSQREGRSSFYVETEWNGKELTAEGSSHAKKDWFAVFTANYQLNQDRSALHFQVHRISCKRLKARVRASKKVELYTNENSFLTAKKGPREFFSS